MNKDKRTGIEDAVELILGSTRTTAFTGAGISVESGIPPFRGKNGLWNRVDPYFLDIGYFMEHPEESWEIIKKIFYDFFGKTSPNQAHMALAELERMGLLQCVITQNIDNLHQEAGSRMVHEFHGNFRDLACTGCSERYLSSTADLDVLPPRCKKCDGVLKPDFVFFGEPIPPETSLLSFNEADSSDLFIVIGTSGEIMPASAIPFEAKKRKKKIIEINTEPSAYTGSITDIYLEGKATVIMQKILSGVKSHY